MSNTYEKTYTIRSTKEVFHKFETFLSFMHFNGGHTGLFAMPFDGDGHEWLTVDPAPDESLRDVVHKVSGVGAGVEIAYAGETGVAFIDWDKTNRWRNRVEADVERES